MKTCCEKCKLVAGHPDKTFYCSHFTCPCHTPQKCPHGVWSKDCAKCFEEDGTPIAQKEEGLGWRMGFNDFLEKHRGQSITEIPNEVASFISSLLAKEREKTTYMDVYIAGYGCGKSLGKKQVLTQLREVIENLQKNRGVVHLYDAALQDILVEISKLTT